MAQDDTTQQSLSRRIQCMMFLATPHRGSDYAALLNRILKVTGFSSAREYVRDISAGSTSSQLINDEFGKYAHELRIHSFYETLEMKIGVSSALIVDKNSAVLGKHTHLHDLLLLGLGRFDSTSSCPGW